MYTGLLLLALPFAAMAQLPSKALSGAKTPTPSVTWPENVTRIVPLGRDGGNRYYLVTCRDRSRTSVQAVIGTGKVCAQRPRQKLLCKTGWRPLQAGAYACPR